MPVTGYVCYCDDLHLYHYHLVESEKPGPEGIVDYKFDDDELEDAIATHLASDNKADASFMAHVTGLARLNPHKFVVIDSSKDDFPLVEPKQHWADHPTIE